MKRHSTFIRLFLFMKKGLPVYMFSLLMIGFIYLLDQVFIAEMFKQMFDAIENKNLDILISSVRFYIILIILLSLIAPFFYYLIYRVIAITTGTIRNTIFEKLGRLPLGFFKGRHSGDIVSRMTNDISETEKIYNQYFIELVTWLIVGIGSIIISFLYDWRLALIAVVAALLSLLVNLYYAKILRVLSKDIQEKLAKLNEIVTNLLNGVNIIRSFNLQQMISNRFVHRNDEVYEASMDRVKIKAVVSGINGIIGFLSFGCIATFGSYLVIKGSLTFGDIVAIVQLQNGPRVLVNILGTFVTNIQTSLACGDRLFEVIDEGEEPESYDLVSTAGISEAIIETKNLSFQYDKEKVLNNLSLKIHKGNVVAIVGPSGCGKSTLFKVILNFYKPLSGELLINGKTISTQKIKDIRSLFAYVPQDAYLFSGSIADNIRQGRDDATMDEIIQAAQIANAHDFIMKLEDGYNTKVGERGMQLSGGQRQRIAISRAILKDAPILLLDEATSALDTESEILVQDALEKLMKDKTTLVIAHRLSTIQNADEILVLNDGQIVEKGKHNELLLEKGIYKNLYNKQFKLSTN